MHARRPLTIFYTVLLCLLGMLCIVLPGQTQSLTAVQVKQLRGELKDKDAEVRFQAVLRLGSIGQEAASSIMDLLPMLKEPDAKIRAAAISALGRIGPQA